MAPHSPTHPDLGVSPAPAATSTWRDALPQDSPRLWCRPSTVGKGERGLAVFSTFFWGRENPQIMDFKQLSSNYFFGDRHDTFIPYHVAHWIIRSSYASDFRLDNLLNPHIWGGNRGGYKVDFPSFRFLKVISCYNSNPQTYVFGSTFSRIAFHHD